jgi:hypothetical protein
MARYVNKIKAVFDPVGLAADIERYLVEKGFVLTDYNGSAVWKQGNDLGVPAKYIEILFEPNAVTVSAFVTPAFGKTECDLTGFVGIVPKKALSKVVIGVEKLIRR